MEFAKRGVGSSHTTEERNTVQHSATRSKETRLDKRDLQT